MAISKLQHRFSAGERLSAGKLNAPLDKIDELVEETNKFDGVADALESLSPDQSGALKLAQKVVDVEKNSARKNSYYSTLGSGSADCIAPRGNAVAQTIGSGVAAKDATKKIVRLKGKTMRWQNCAIIQSISFGDAFVEIGTISLTSVHKILAVATFYGITNNNARFYLAGYNSAGVYVEPSVTAKNGTCEIVADISGYNNEILYMRVRNGYGDSRYTNAALIDLTACGLESCNTADDVANVFGYATWDAFAASPNFASLMEYTEQPRLINTNAVGIRTTDGYGEEHYVDIDAKRVVDSEGHQLFPDGLQGVGSTFDELKQKKATARMKKARLADFSWTYYNGRFFALIADAKRVTTYPYGEHTHAVCSLYPIDSSTTSTQDDKTIRVSQGNDTSGYMYIRDTDYSDVPSFVAHLGDAELVYELATPIEIDLAHPLNLTYPVSKGGVEAAVYEGEAGLPIEADVIEGMDVYSELEKLKNQIALLTAQSEE